MCHTLLFAFNFCSQKHQAANSCGDHQLGSLQALLFLYLCFQIACGKEKVNHYAILKSRFGSDFNIDIEFKG